MKAKKSVCIQNMEPNIYPYPIFIHVSTKYEIERPANSAYFFVKNRTGNICLLESGVYIYIYLFRHVYTVQTVYNVAACPHFF